MPKSIFLVHGRSFKPPRSKLRRLWLDAVESGLRRDASAAKVRAFKDADKQFIYYGDISNRFLKKALKKPANYDTDDSVSRRATLRELQTYAANQFTRARYRKLEGQSGSGEALADLFGGVAAFFGVSDPLIAAIAPDMREYWNFESPFGSEVRATLTVPLARALRRGHRVMVIGHSLGSIIAFDTLWKLSHYSEHRDIRSRKIDLLVTLGSPLADETVKRKLKGAESEGRRRYPHNIRRWVNVAAEDDYISHDERVRNDYRKMLTYGLTDSIRDVGIYNLAVRNGDSNPHHSGGYLIHPKVTEIIASWV